MNLRQNQTTSSGVAPEQFSKRPRPIIVDHAIMVHAEDESGSTPGESETDEIKCCLKSRSSPVVSAVRRLSVISMADTAGYAMRQV